MATDGTLTITVHAQAIANYDGPAVTAELYRLCRRPRPLQPTTPPRTATP